MLGLGLRLFPHTGKSDPFVVFTLNGQKVHKSQTKKKTVNPDWHESFVVQVVRSSALDMDVRSFPSVFAALACGRKLPFGSV